MSLVWAELQQLHAVRNVAKLLSRRWGLGLGFVDGSDSPHPPRPRVRGLCPLVQARPGGEAVCVAHAGATPAAGLHVCPLGLTELAVPLVDGDEALGYLLVGGFVRVDGADAALAEAERRLGRLGIADEGFGRAAHPRLATHDLEVIQDMLLVCADEIVAVGAERRASAAPTRYSYDAIIGPSPAMQELYRVLDKVIGSDSTVLIQGENGTGKELIAKAIHFNSSRKDRRFLVQNCSAFNDNLLDSELFGHKKGAFTGAIADKQGLFEAADGGTFFLDEIGDMSPALQVKLLRVLQEGTFMPVGDTTVRRTDVRIIAATNRDLRAMVARGEFREDLYYRINVINMVLPPLRERKEDVPILVEHFLKRHGRSRRAARRLTPACLARMLAYPWPGNVRELENEIERLVVLAGDERVIGEELLSPRIRQHGSDAAAKEPDGLPGALAQLERTMIDEALRRHRGNKTRAARELKISRRNLIRLAQKYAL
jgi:transcriptional regulator with PAS, ATPase and Fis domain